MSSEIMIMTAQEVAELLRISRATVTRLAQRGELARIPVAGRLLFTRLEVTRFVSGQRQNGAPL
ncbi:helix-turn-helix domain-containing protein [Bosea sp. SSUT16]|uniref:Helix-turn-helix domain-containing protein n=2 Tax=Bosea spartocytisi TaxID=2773451 RepID=A0A927EDT5_9HYPH|nr:helix-turn-helix domain-containing protein [Bosea spartocytisi]